MACVKGLACIVRALENSERGLRRVRNFLKSRPGGLSTLKSLGELDGHGCGSGHSCPTTLRLVDRAAAGVRGCIHRSGQTKIGTAFGVLRSVLCARHVSDSFPTSDSLKITTRRLSVRAGQGLYGKVTVGG